MFVCVFTHHTFCSTPGLIPFFLCTASSHIQSSHQSRVRTAPCSFFVSLSSSNSGFSLPLPLPKVPVKSMLLALLALRICQEVLPCSTLDICTENWNFIFHPLTLCLLRPTSFPGKEGLFPRHCSPQPLQPTVIHSLALKSTHRL